MCIQRGLYGLLLPLIFLCNSVVSAEKSHSLFQLVSQLTKRIANYQSQNSKVLTSLQQLQQLLHHPLLSSEALHPRRMQEFIQATPAESAADNIVQQRDALFRLLQVQQMWQQSQGEGIRIALIDTGIDWLHPALRGKLFINTAEDINGNGRFDPWRVEEERDGITGDLDGQDNDGNGLVDDIMGYDFTVVMLPTIGDWKEPDPIPEDENGHGTAMGGIMVGEDKDFITGIAKQSTLIPIKALTKTGITSELSIVAAILYATILQADCINLSYGNYYVSPLVQAALRVAAASGIIIVASAGNEGRDAWHFPSDFNTVLSVGATTIEGQRAIFSNYGAGLDIVAPGVNIPTLRVDGGFQMVSGTSIAAALTTAAIAIIRSAHPNWPPSYIMQALFTTAVDHGDPGWDPFFGHGRIAPYTALRLPAPGTLHIAFPQHLQAIERRYWGDILPIHLTIDEPQLDSAFLLLYRRNSSYKLLDTLCVLTQRSYETQCSLNLTTIDDGEYLLKLHAKLLNGQTIRAKTAFILTSQSPQLLSYTATPLWWGNQRILLVEAITKLPTVMRLRWRATNQQQWQVIDNRSVVSSYHAFTVEPETSGIHHLMLEFWHPGGNDTSYVQWQQNFLLQHVPRSSMEMRASVYPQPVYWATNIMRQTSDTILGTVLNPDFSFGELVAFRWKDDTLTLLDHFHEGWIARGWGDIDGDGRKEILIHHGSTTKILSTAKRVFGRLLWESDTLWGAGFFDLDGDGRDEIIFRSDRAYFIARWNSAQQRVEILTELPNTSDPDPWFGSNFFGLPLVRITDLDRDGYYEIIFADSDGDVLIYQYNGGPNLSIDTVLHTNLWGSDGYLAIGDIDGDQQPELLVGYTTLLLPASEYGPAPRWILRIYKASRPNQYRLLIEESFFGARPQSPYRSGIQCQDIESDGKDEIFLFLYPHCFIFRFSDHQQLQPFFIADSVITNTLPSIPGALIISQFQRVVQFAPLHPLRQWAISGLRAQQIDTTTARIRWDPLPVSSYRVIITSSLTGRQDTILTSQPEVFLSDLRLQIQYHIKVEASQSIPDTLQLRLRPPPRLVTVSTLTSGVLLLRYDRTIAPKTFNPGWIRLYDSTGSVSMPEYLHLVGRYTLAAYFTTLSGGRYRGIVAAFDDGYLGRTLPDTFYIQFRRSMPSHPRFYVTNAQYDQTTNELRITFNKPVDPQSAQCLHCYAIVPSRKVLDVQLDNDSTIVLIVDAHTPLRPIGRPYILFVQSVTSRDGDTINPNTGNTIAILIPPDSLSSPILFPNPISLSSHHLLTISNLTLTRRATIRTANGAVVQPALSVLRNGVVEWDLLDQNGKLIEPGIYIIELYDTNGERLHYLKVLVLP